MAAAESVVAALVTFSVPFLFAEGFLADAFFDTDTFSAAEDFFALPVFFGATAFLGEEAFLGVATSLEATVFLEAPDLTEAAAREEDPVFFFVAVFVFCSAPPVDFDPDFGVLFFDGDLPLFDKPAVLVRPVLEAVLEVGLETDCLVVFSAMVLNLGRTVKVVKESLGALRTKV